MPEQQGVMSTYQLTAHNHSGVGQGGLVDPTVINHDTLLNFVALEHLLLPNTIVNVLSDHNKVAHDALNIDADQVDGEHANAITTNARVKAHFPDTIANVLSNHTKAVHDALAINADQVDGEEANAIVTNARVKAHFPDAIADIITGHNMAIHNALKIQGWFGGTPTELTINLAGAVTIGAYKCYYRIDTKDNDATDNLDTINGGGDGQIIVLRSQNDARNVVVTETGNIELEGGGVFGLNATRYKICLIYDGGINKWCELTRFTG